MDALLAMARALSTLRGVCERDGVKARWRVGKKDDDSLLRPLPPVQFLRSCGLVGW